ncbi:hypothetical protein LB505_006992 [Fusarium chuoi]|nr:hypothetical protein LB505_006992 [Fusarium chuoi]
MFDGFKSQHVARYCIVAIPRPTDSAVTETSTAREALTRGRRDNSVSSFNSRNDASLLLPTIQLQGRHESAKGMFYKPISTNSSSGGGLQLYPSTKRTGAARWRR